MTNKTFAASSLAAQALGWIDPVTKAVVPPIHMASTYQRDEDNGYSSGRIYARPDNPTFDQAEATLAALEGGPKALISANQSVSGMRQVISRLMMADSGKFFAYDGQLVPW